MTEALKDMHTKFGEARGFRGRGKNLSKTLRQNFNACVDGYADVGADMDLMLMLMLGRVVYVLLELR